MLDQTRLPGERVDRRCATTAELCAAIRELAIRGAPAIGIAAAMGMAQAARRSPARDRAGAARRARAARARSWPRSRPTAINLGWALDRCDEAIARAPPAARAASCAAALRSSARAAHPRRRGRALPSRWAATAPSCCRPARACSRTATPAALATGGYGSALGVVRAAHARRSGHPRLGRRDAPAAAGRAPDGLGARRGRHLAHADRRRRGGAAVRARARRRRRLRRRPHRAQRRRREQDRLVHALGARGRPRRAVLRRRALLDDRPRDRERRGDPDRGARRATRSRASAGARRAPAGTRVSNPAFDVTPAANITAIVTEAGVHRAPFEQSLPAAAT